MPWGAAVSAGVGLVGSALQSNATSAAAEDATNAETQMYLQTREDLSPYRTAGAASLTQQQNLLGLNGQAAANTAMQTYQTSPGYQWQVSEGLRGVDAGAAASGFTRSGANEKAELTYAQGLANSDFGTYYNRLNSMTTTGATAAGQQATSNTNTADSLSNIYTSTGSQQSSIYGSAASGLSSTINSLLKNTSFSDLIGSGTGSQYTGTGSASDTTRY